MKKKILYDSEVFYTFSFGGISRYFTEILKGFKSSNEFEFLLPIRYSDNKYLASVNLPEKPIPVPQYYNNFLPNLNFKGKGMLFRMINSLSPYPDPIVENKKLVIETLKKGNFDLFHATYYDDYYLDYLRDKPLVITIHDMIFELFPEYFLDCSIRNKKLKHIERANHIITVSENTKKDLINICGVDEKIISVIYHGASKLGEPSNKKEALLNFSEDYLLFVGNRERYKNFYFLLLSLKSVFIDYPHLKLIVTGKALSKLEILFIKEEGLEGRVVYINSDDSGLSVLYKNALAFIYPSLYEGFGMPILEAFSCNCPVLLSNSSCFTEIAGDAAVYFNPKDIKDISAKVLSVLNNETLRRSLIMKGKERVLKFTWEESVRKTFDVYSSLVNKS